jgi:hypothetical protein
VKVPVGKIALKPSWMIETSEGNFQIGFILDAPITDASQADQLLNAIIDAGLTDPGASGPCSRIGRLPLGINGKYQNSDGSPWQCRLVEWHPQLRYSMNELLNGLGIELKDPALKQPSSAKHPPASHRLAFQSLDDVHIPRADEHPVITALKNSGRYKQPLGAGKHDITCPWVDEHTAQIDQGTAYWQPSENYPLGGFKCLHGHCANRRVSELYEFLGIDKVSAKHKPIILVQPGELPRICNAAEIELAKTLAHYQRGGSIVVIITDPSTRETVVKVLSQPSLTRALADLIIWQRFDKKSQEWLVCDPPERYVRVLFDAATYPHLPVLNGIARQPYLRADGTLMTNAGYDFATGMYGVFDASQFKVPSSPTRQDAENALSQLQELLNEFVFKTQHDHAAAISGILTATARPTLSNAPMFHVKAPSISSGKSYLCELFTAFASPQKGTPHAFPADDEECRKLLLAELLTAPAVVEFDNLTNDLVPHKTLCSALTSEYISGRILGQSKTAEVNTRALFLSSGNNVQPVRDMTRRTITITLDPACEMPAARSFKKQPVAEVKANRAYFVSLALIIIRAWIVAGQPLTECKPIATYSDWSNYCRQPLLWLGLPDPAQCIFESMNEDPDRELLGDFLIAWFSRFHNSPTLVKHVIEAAKPVYSGFGGSSNLNEALQDAITEIAAERDGTINRKRLGWWIKRNAGRVVHGMRFVQDKATTSNAVKWKVEQLEST